MFTVPEALDVDKLRYKIFIDGVRNRRDSVTGSRLFHVRATLIRMSCRVSRDTPSGPFRL